MFSFLTYLKQLRAPAYVWLRCYSRGLTSGFSGFDLSYDEVNQAVALFISFVFAMASAPCSFLYVSQRIGDLKKIILLSSYNWWIILELTIVRSDDITTFTHMV